MRVLGIDLSLTGTGCVILEDGEIKEKVLIKTKNSGKLPNDELKRLLYIRDQINMEKIDLAVMEGLAMNARNTSSLTQGSGLNYLVRDRLSRSKIPFCICQPTTLKKFATGKGNCPKDNIMLEVYKRWSVDITDNNLCDAFVLAKIGESLLGGKGFLTKPQKEVIELLKIQLTQ